MLSRSLLLLPLLPLLLAGAAGEARADALSLEDLFAVGTYVECARDCPGLPAEPTYAHHVARLECLAGCGQPPRLWEKSGTDPVDRTDLELAVLEYMDGSDPNQLVCYRDKPGWDPQSSDPAAAERGHEVVPGPLCAGKACEDQKNRPCTPFECAAGTDTVLECEDLGDAGVPCWWPEIQRPARCPDVVCDAVPPPSFSSTECSDEDSDSIPEWLEHALGKDPGVADALCGNSQPCSFDERCVYDGSLGAGTCAEMACAATGDCTAFDLERVAQTDQEVVVHVFYDSSPVPARVLDLHVSYDSAALILQDARPLPALTLFSKQLAVTHRADGTLRLLIYDVGSTYPVPPGPVVELVFRRNGDEATAVAFSADPALRKLSVAPLQGDDQIQDELEADGLWGSAVDVPARAAVPTRLRLWYGFESLDEPFAYRNVPGPDALCDLLADCANEPDATERSKQLARLAALQRGELLARDQVEGVTRRALYLSGSNDHLRFPVHLADTLSPAGQELSLSLWFYAEGNSADEQSGTPQLLYSHNAFSERTRFGLRLVPGGGGGSVSLSFFEGDLLAKRAGAGGLPEDDVKDTVIEAEVPLRTWHNVGFALDPAAGEAVLYFDGQERGTHVFSASTPAGEPKPAAVVCPQFPTNTEIALHDEGSVLGGLKPSFVYVAVNRSNLYRVERMDPSGLGSQLVLGDGQASYRDPDYSPILDKIAYSSNAGGDFEIWIANGDGSERRQVTVGFGDRSRGIAARRPRWAPDGSAIVFESAVYDVTRGDNDFARVSHLYYVGYDARKNEVAVELVGGATASQLDYVQRLADQSVDRYRLTARALDRNHSNARWLRGKDAETGDRGVLLCDSSSPRFDGHRVRKISVADNIPATTSEPMTSLDDPSRPYDEIRLLTAHRSERFVGPTPTVVEQVLYRAERTDLVAEDQYTLSVLDAAPDADPVRVRVEHDPNGYAADCWDRNRNALEDTDEDRNGDGAWDDADCTPKDVANLLVEYDAAFFTPILEDEDGNPHEPGALLETYGKELRFGEEFPSGRAFVRVRVLSPTNLTPLPAGEVAVLHFKRREDGAPGVRFAPVRREGSSRILLKDLTGADAPTPFAAAGRFEHVFDAAFDPDGERLLLAAVSRARPVLLRTAGLLSAAGSERIAVAPLRVSGVDWVRQTRIYPCNWAGAYQHPATHLMTRGFRGGLDDLKVWSGLRDEDAFRSEAERGLEQLAAEVERGEREAEVPSLLPSCGNAHSECPPFHLCVASECVLVPCDPEDPYSCTGAGGRCTMRPLAVETELKPGAGQPGFDWVCAADCNVDRQCFTHACLNGPCRFCETESLTCIECQESVSQLGALTLSQIEGCPDRRSFACEAGACVTECYEFVDGRSVYLCDPALEYCSQGRCVLLDWDWWDLAPATFAGVSEARKEVPPGDGWNGYTQAIDQRIPIKLVAYGVADYARSPEVVVEVKGGPFYGGDWHRVAMAQVHARTATEAQREPIQLSSPHIFNAMRLRLVTGPYSNVSGAATGLGPADKDFCAADLARHNAEVSAHNAANPGAERPLADPSVCYLRAQGSRFNLGYRVGIPLHESIRACREKGRAGCPGVSQTEHDFLYGGSPAVVVLDVEADGASVMNGITRNDICSYEGGLQPVDGGAAKKVFYGDLSDEVSNQKDTFCKDPANVAACEGGRGLVAFDHEGQGFALLNCNYFNPVTTEMASVEIGGVVIVKPWPAREGPIVLDNGDTCTVELDAARVEPCYVSTGGDASIDPYNGFVTLGSFEVFEGLELSLLKSFGHDEGFERVPLPSFDLRVELTGYTGTGLVLANGSDTLAHADLVAGGGPGEHTGSFAEQVALGRRYDVRVQTQPTPANLRCSVSAELGSDRMAHGGATVPVSCGLLQPVGGVVSGLKDVLLLRNRRFDGPGGAYIASDALTISADGPYAFSHLLQPGQAYLVEVARQPAGQRCTVANGSGAVALASVTNVQITCVDVIPRTLSFELVGLEGEGLELAEAESNQRVELDQPGSYTPDDGTTPPPADDIRAFPAQLLAGSPYRIVVTKQPLRPRQVCEITSGGAGTMPDADHLGAVITCTDLPTHTVSGTVLGLLGRGLQVQLNGDPQGVQNITASSDPRVPPTFTFATGLVEGESYEVTVKTHPSNPAQHCTVQLGRGTVETWDVSDVLLVCETLVDGTSYRVGGSVSGLRGKGLRLSLNGGQQLNLDSDGSSSLGFTFSQPLGDRSDYEVEVERQPADPVQRCEVQSNGSGSIDGADVTNVSVVCGEGGKVTIELRPQGAEGAHVKALLFSNAAPVELVAEAPDDVQVDAGVAAFVMEAPGSSTADAVLSPGTYNLFAFVNTDGDTDGATGEPIFEAGELAFFAQVDVVAGSPALLSLGPGDAVDLVAQPVSAEGFGGIADPSLRCYWAAPGAGALSLPPTDGAPVLGNSGFACTPEAEPCGEEGVILSDANDPLPLGASLDLTCWSDVDQSDDLSSGDLSASRSAVPVTGTATVITLSVQP